MPNMNLKGVAPARPMTSGKPGGAPGAEDQKQKKKLLGLPMPIALGVSGVLGVGLVVGILFLTGVLGEDPKPKFERPVPPVDTSTSLVAETTSLAKVVPEKTVTKVEPAKTATKNNSKNLPKTNGFAKNKFAGSPGGAYSIQVESWSSPSKANSRAQVYSNAGFQAFVDKGGRKNNFRVFLGKYPTRNEARRAAEKIAHMLESGYSISKLN